MTFNQEKDYNTIFDMSSNNVYALFDRKKMLYYKTGVTYVGAKWGPKVKLLSKNALAQLWQYVHNEKLAGVNIVDLEIHTFSYRKIDQTGVKKWLEEKR